MLSVKQLNIKYHFLVFGMTRPGIEPGASGTIDEHSTHLASSYRTIYGQVMRKIKQ